MSTSRSLSSRAYRRNMVERGIPTPVRHSASDGHTRSSDVKAYRDELRISSIESMSVPSRSKRTAGRDETLMADSGLWAPGRRSYGNTDGHRARERADQARTQYRWLTHGEQNSPS